MCAAPRDKVEGIVFAALVNVALLRSPRTDEIHSC